MNKQYGVSKATNSEPETAVILLLPLIIAGIMDCGIPVSLDNLQALTPKGVRKKCKLFEGDIIILPAESCPYMV